MRIVTQEELDRAEVEPAYVFWGNRSDCSACTNTLSSRFGCTSKCVRANGREWVWHGLSGEMPTPETILIGPFIFSEAIPCPTCGVEWVPRQDQKDYIVRVHARAATLAAASSGDFDEATERARLMPV